MINFWLKYSLIKEFDIYIYVYSSIYILIYILVSISHISFKIFIISTICCIWVWLLTFVELRLYIWHFCVLLYLFVYLWDVCMGMWRPKICWWDLSSITFTSFSEAKSLSWTKRSLIWLPKLACLPQRVFVFAFQKNRNYRWYVILMWHFCSFRGSKLKPSYLGSKYFIHWAIAQVYSFFFYYSLLFGGPLPSSQINTKRLILIYECLDLV